MARRWKGYDLDGSIAYYEHDNGIDAIGDPIPEMVDHLKVSLAEGYEVRIVTARVARINPPAFIALQTAMIEEWCLKHIGQVLPVTSEKDFNMVRLYDDRATELLTNRGLFIKDRD